MVEDNNIKSNKKYIFSYIIFGVLFIILNVFIGYMAFRSKKITEINFKFPKPIIYSNITSSNIPNAINIQKTVVINPTPTNPIIPSAGVIPTPKPSSTPVLTPTPSISSPSSSNNTPPNNDSTYQASTIYDSSNWSGYVSIGSNFTEISGSWTVPNISSAGNQQISSDAAWIGIGGVTSNDLIQAGTVDSIDSNGNTYYFAFFELLPNYATVIPKINLAPGDNMNISIQEINSSLNEWEISIDDLTQNEIYNTTVYYNSTNSSAEWIEEDPTNANGNLYSLPDFNQVEFSNCLAVNNNISVNLANLKPASIVLVDNNRNIMATPSDISNSGDFTVKYLTSN